MSEGSAVILPKDEEQVLGRIIDKIGNEKPDLAKALRLCAIPHWFNKEILAWLRGERTKPSNQTETILEELQLKKLAFVGPGNLFLHDNVRNLLLHSWRKQNPEDFQSLNGKVAAYYEYKLQTSVSSDEHRAEWEREEMYHLLVADKERGINRFKSLCNKAIDSYRLSTLDLLFSIAGEQVDDLSIGIQHWIQFFEGKKTQLSSDWEEALEVWEKLKEKRAVFTGDLEPTLAVHLSLLYKDKGKWGKAIECLEESLKFLEGKGDQHGMITILNNRGFLYKDRENWQEAEDDFQRGLEVSRKIGDTRGMAISLKNLGILCKDRGKWDQALKHSQNSLVILKRIGDQRAIARGYDDRGLMYKDRGLLNEDRKDFQKAEDDFERALKILGKIGNEHEQAAAFNSLGLFYKDLGVLYKDKEYLQKAENNFQSAREILERIGDQHRVADIFNYLGFLYTAAIDWDDAHFGRALTNFQGALTILKEMGDERGTAVILNNLGLLYQRKGELQPAADYFHQSLALVETIGDKLNASTTMYELALLYDAMGENDKAIELLEKVVKISARVGHPDSRIRKSREKLEMVKAK
ncbi:MAG: tetratricopeptide repeat protein [Pyrinomonadaceae bacterium]